MKKKLILLSLAICQTVLSKSNISINLAHFFNKKKSYTQEISTLIGASEKVSQKIEQIQASITESSDGSLVIEKIKIYKDKVSRLISKIDKELNKVLNDFPKYKLLNKKFVIMLKLLELTEKEYFWHLIKKNFDNPGTIGDILKQDEYLKYAAIATKAITPFVPPADTAFKFEPIMAEEVHYRKEQFYLANDTNLFKNKIVDKIFVRLSPNLFRTKWNVRAFRAFMTIGVFGGMAASIIIPLVL